MYDYNYDFGEALRIFWIVFLVLLIIALIIGIIQLIAQWKIYKKAGKGGWEAIVPFYCNWVLVEISGLKWYWFLFFFAPMLFQIFELDNIGWLVYIFGMFNIFYNLSKKFNRGVGFAICLTLFTPICMWILGFSKKSIYDKNVAVSPNGVFGSPDDNIQNSSQQSNVGSTPEQQVQSQSNQNPAFCTNCGNALLPDSKFCTNCGKQI